MSSRNLPPTRQPRSRTVASAGLLCTLLLVVACQARGQDMVSNAPFGTQQAAHVLEVERGTSQDTSVDKTLPQKGPLDAGTRPLDPLNPETWVEPDRLLPSLQMMLMLGVLSLAPAVLLMTTSFVRIVVVLGLLRHALGTHQLPSNQVVTSLALFMTALVMTPTWTEVYQEAIVPYTQEEGEISLEEAWQRGVQPVRNFMSRQIDIAGNHEDVHLFYRYLPDATELPETFDDVPLQVLVPAFVVSELKTAFLIGFQIYLPFLIVDLVVSSVTVSMGMMMLPPMMISLPLKLMLFVLVDGWRLVVGMLLESFFVFS